MKSDVINRQAMIDFFIDVGMFTAAVYVLNFHGETDMISCKDAIEAFKPYAKYESNMTNKDWVRRIEVVLRNLSEIDTPCDSCSDEDYCTVYPDKCPDINAYTETLWRFAYERGKKDATLYGYKIEHLEIIAMLLEKENLPPERVSDALHDIYQVVDIVVKEFNDTLRKVMTNNESKG